MDITIHPGRLSGEVNIIPSKSMAHRMLICAAFADGPTELICAESNEDIDATADCLRSLGADILRTKEGFSVIPVREIPSSAELNCRESGSTLRFLLPVAGALGVTATIQMAGRLPNRPLSPLWEEMERMGCRLSRPTEKTILCQGKLRPGKYSIAGNVSSQFISGLLFAFELMEEECELEISGKLESAPYVRMTEDALDLFFNYRKSPDRVTVEGDWSNGAFWLAAKELGNDIRVNGLSRASVQGDKQISRLLPQLKQGCATVTAADIPDLVPILSVFAACNHGAVFTDIQRLRLKESDRVAAVLDMLQNLGGKAEATKDKLTVYGTGLTGGTVDARNDHRIAMSAAIAATVCQRDVTVLGAECVKKSYPKFWDEYIRMGGNYELYLR